MKRTKVRKKEQKLYEENATNKVLDLLFVYPNQEFSLSGIADALKVSKSTVKRVLEKLFSYELIKINKLNIIWRITANLKNPAFVNYKLVRNLSWMIQSNIVDYLEKFFKIPKAIVLFGSFSKGEDIVGSDIDIAVEIDEEKELQILEFEDFKPIEASLNRKIKVYVFNRKNIDLNLFNSIANGIILSGFLKVNP